ncbi:MAG: hypothetical protein JXA33_10390 [Anaerolineae bacterium]|nr:hypothetical protein [Anaerolineae bacterium]
MIAMLLRWRESHWPWRRWEQPTPDYLHHQQLHYRGGPNLHWLAMLDVENVQTVILHRYEDRELLRLLRHSPYWTVDFADWQSVILMRVHEGQDSPG